MAVDHPNHLMAVDHPNHLMVVANVVAVRRFRPAAVDQVLDGGRLNDVRRSVVGHELGTARNGPSCL